MSMQTRVLGRTGLSVSFLGFGSAPAGLLEREQERVGTILNELLDAGVNLIDTAAAYAGSEEAIGKTAGDGICTKIVNKVIIYPDKLSCLY